MTGVRNWIGGTLLSGVVLLAACQQADSPAGVASRDMTVAATTDDADAAAAAAASQLMSRANAQLAARGFGIRIVKAEWITAGETNHAGQTVFANDRQKQLPLDFVPGDPGRGGRTNITYLVDQSDGAANAPGSDLTNAQTEAAIDRSIDTWNGATCSNLPIDKLPDSGADPDIVDFLLGLGGPGLINFGPVVVVDIVQAGWVPRALFDAIGPPPGDCTVGEDCGGDFILGVTFTFNFTDEDGNDLDINNDSKIDTAFSEIFYNNEFQWGIDVPGFFPVFDVETVALHETGHGLSQGHFGRIFRTDANGLLHFAPEAVMNAAVFGQKQSLFGTDNGGHCSIWGNWPNN